MEDSNLKNNDFDYELKLFCKEKEFELNRVQSELLLWKKKFEEIKIKLENSEREKSALIRYIERENLRSSKANSMEIDVKNELMNLNQSSSFSSALKLNDLSYLNHFDQRNEIKLLQNKINEIQLDYKEMMETCEKKIYQLCKNDALRKDEINELKKSFEKFMENQVNKDENISKVDKCCQYERPKVKRKCRKRMKSNEKVKSAPNADTEEAIFMDNDSETTQLCTENPKTYSKRKLNRK